MADRHAHIPTDDVARFRAGDPDALVAASFACPWCLHRPAAVVVAGAEHECAASCVCADCARGWRVALSVEQSLRMALAPPREFSIRRPPGERRPQGTRWRR
jgi:hypothetical protein